MPCATGPARTKQRSPLPNIGPQYRRSSPIKKSKPIKATKPRIRKKAKSNTADIKMRAHMPVMAGDPIPRTKAKPSKS